MFILSKLFHWLWPPIVQTELDSFKEYWNTHYVRNQPNKNMPSGGTPRDFSTRPEAYNGQRLSVPVDYNIVEELRAQLPVSREEAFRWVDDEFAAQADEVYANIGSPPLSLRSGWQIFSQMSPMLEEV